MPSLSPRIDIAATVCFPQVPLPGFAIICVTPSWRVHRVPLRPGTTVTPRVLGWGPHRTGSTACCSRPARRRAPHWRVNGSPCALTPSASVASPCHRAGPEFVFDHNWPPPRPRPGCSPAWTSARACSSHRAPRASGLHLASTSCPDVTAPATGVMSERENHKTPPHPRDRLRRLVGEFWAASSRFDTIATTGPFTGGTCRRCGPVSRCGSVD
jgi:hypothetical protein